ncbi:MAG TPA: M50 family metallopeptidase [Acidimicrobiales bacterium]
MTRAHFRILGVPVRVEPLFIIVAVLLGYRLEPVWVVFAWVVIVFVSVLVHELGHAFTYRVLGQRSAVVLQGFGGFTIPIDGGRRVLSKPKSILVSVSGSLAQIFLVGIPARIAWQSDWGQNQLNGYSFGDWEFNITVVLYYLQLVSIVWGVLNLLPIRPLDGGHVAEELIGFETACKLSIVTAAVAGIYLMVEWDSSLFILIWMGLFAYMNYRDLQAGRNENFEVDAPEGGASGHPARAGGGGGRGRKRGGHLQAVPTPTDLAAQLAPPDQAEVEARVWNALRAGDADRAAAMLKQSGSRTPSGFVQASVAMAQGHTSIAVDLFESAYRAEPGGPPNLVPATLLDEQGQAVALARVLVVAGPAGVEAAASLQTHLHYADRFRSAAEVGEVVFAAGPTSPAQTAFEVACSWARADRADEALRWIEAAVDAGFKAPGLLDSEPDLAPVRALAGWSAVRSRLTA